MGDTDWPFLGTEARRDGEVSRRALRRHQRIYRDVYLPVGTELTPVRRAAAAWLWSGRAATVAGLSASALHGSRWIDGSSPAELIRPQACAVDGIVIHRDALVDGEVCVVRGIPTTTPARTAFDLGRRDSLVAAVMRVDALANATRLTPPDIAALVPRHRGARGLVQLRTVLDLMDSGAESPRETRTRLLLLAAGFPRPRTQVMVCDEHGYFIGRIDMGWPGRKVGIEYDGPQHWTDPAVRARDIDRLAELQGQGWTIIRVSRDILRYRPEVFLQRVRDAMRAAGWPEHGRVRLDARLDTWSGCRVFD
ncbi:DUF559 domain-containing protein [Mycolicibacterium psychrotolerans]|uniref:DUF559 domain-containing protein n=1 Tax=Mycolicibacterium psychrotolerans TaxID=216929 RepID=A0A7I7M8N0_9MYCO|nr:DUF559 domain-containing protein [Mycolicibacterium psychrotolerans]BBX68535.1 hypothetical protein MPSYJ_19960 [Mycolicibacterium psychrotolerans]